MARRIAAGPMEPREVEFVNQYRTLKTRLHQEEMEDVLRTIPKLGQLRFEVNKILTGGGIPCQHPIIIYVGKWGSDHWACLDGKVIQDRPDTLYGGSAYWTAAMRNDYSPPRPAPFNASTELEEGLVTPMSPETLALARFYIVRQAEHTNQQKKKIDFPDLDNLLKALRQISQPPTAASRTVFRSHTPSYF
jgi:hypothetical protein